MTARDDEPVLEQLADLLPPYDDALREGTPPPIVDLPSSAPELPARLHRAQACLRLLRGRWPGRQTDHAADVPAASGPMSDLASPGAQLGRFAIIRLLGRGGHGVVYLARDPVLRREVALKVARPETFLDADLHGRFRREAASAAGLDHPNLVPVHELGQVGPWVYIVSAYCPGPSLAAWLREQREPVAIATAARFVAALADAVAYMHGRGVLHRDIKPGNVLLVPNPNSELAADQASDLGDSKLGIASDFTPKITDFGLAKVADGTRYQTQSGVVLGTPAYMSPEQAAGRVSDLGPATDIYALGVLLYELLTGRPPFHAERSIEALRQLLHEDPVPPGQLRPGLPRDLESVCLKCLEKKPERRYASAAALADDLRRFLNGLATRARPRTVCQRGWKALWRRPRLSLAVSAGLLALVAVTGVWWYVADIQDSAAALSAEHDRVEADAKAPRQRLYARELPALGVLAMEGRLTASQLAAAGSEELRGFEWYFLRRLAGAERFVGRGHTQAVVRVAFSPDGQLCASAGLDGTIIVWDLATHRQLWSRRHKERAIEVAFSPDGKTLASASDQGPHNGTRLKLWDVATGTEHASFTVPGRQLINTLAFAPDGQTLASCGEALDDSSSSVLLWDLRSGRSRGLGPPEPFWYMALAFSPDGHTLAVGCGHGHGGFPGDAAAPRWGAVQLFDTATGKRTATHTGHSAVVQWLAFTPDGKRLVSADVEATVKVWDVSSGQARLSVRAGTHLALSPDGGTLAMVRGGRELELWDATTGRWIARVGSVPSVHCVRFAPAGTDLVVACDDGTVRLFDARAIHDLPGHRPAEAWAVAFAPDGKKLASAGDDHTIRLWSVPAFKQHSVLSGHIALVTSVAFSPDGRTLASGSFDKKVYLWDAATGREKGVLPGHIQDIRAVAFSPNGRFLASAAWCLKEQHVGELKLWDLSTDKETAAPAAHGNCLAFSRDGGLLAFHDDNNAVQFLDLSTLKATHGLADLASVRCVAFTPDGKMLATADGEGLVKLWDVRKGTEKERLRGHGGKEVRVVVFSPDGKTLASAGMDKTIVLWQAATGLELLRFKDLPDYVHALAFSPDSAILAAACHDGTVRVYQGTATAE
jgi:WD40 repeat protein